MDLFTNVFAVMYPAIAPNARGALGLGLFAVGGAYFPTHIACISDDVSAFECAITIASTQGPDLASDGTVQWGDYVSVRRNWPGGMTWRTTGFGLAGGGDRAHVDPRYIEFGRARDLP